MARNGLREALPPFHGQSVTSARDNDLRHPHLLSPKFLGQKLTMVCGYHLIDRPVNHLDPFSPYFIAKLLDLFRALIVPSGCDGLQDEPSRGPLIRQ